MCTVSEKRNDKKLHLSLYNDYKELEKIQAVEKNENFQ